MALHHTASVYARVSAFLAVIALLVVATTTSTIAYAPVDNWPQNDIEFGKHDNEVKQADLAGIANEGPEDSYEGEQSLLRAYPSTTVSPDVFFNSQSTFQSLKSGKPAVGQWTAIGPLNQAQYPAVLDQFLFDGAPFVASGRVTALAISPSCDGNNCRVYLGAAGGGIWVTDRALQSNNAKWTYVSGSLGSNAIGSLLIDPRDTTGNTLYVGTGEPNASVDSEAGVGIFKTTDGGQTWALIPTTDVFYQRAIGKMAFDKDWNLLVPVASGVRGVSADDGGALSSGSTTHPLITRGVYRVDPTTGARTLLRATSIRGSTEVAVDPNDPNVLYQTSFNEGVWRSLNNGATWTQIKTPINANPADKTDRASFAIAALPNGKTRMYVGDGTSSNTGTNRAHFFRTDDAAGAAAFTDMTTTQNIGYCTSQCWYDNYVISPAGAPDVVYLGGSYSYGEQHKVSNGRAVLLSTDGGATFSDMTLDGEPHPAVGMHPDQHALVTVPGNALQFIVGSDGGVMRSNGQLTDASATCDTRGLNAADTAYCKSLLSSVPSVLTVMNQGLDTLQFQSLSVSSQNPKLLQGGTQDNGTFQYSGSAQIWPQIIYGDGGQSGFKATDDTIRFNTFSGQAHDANFSNGDATKWVIISAPIISSPEGSLFYPPIIADPNPAAAGSIFEGSFSVWRTQDWGGDPATLAANCAEFTEAADKPGCGDFVRIGEPGFTNLTSTAFGATRTGGAVSWMARSPQNTGTMYAATTTGRLFVTDNANDAANLVHWTRLDNSLGTGSAASPNRAITKLYADPANANRVWISYSGYNVNTPTQPGHVFEVVRSTTGTTTTATWTNRTYNLEDLPATAIVRDDVTGDLYAGTDFGVMKLANGATTWTTTGGMPAVEVADLTIVPGARVLYAATHGLGAWSMDLGKAK